MAKVIFFSFPFLGHISFSLKIAHELSKRGEEVYFYSSKKYESIVKESGVIFKKYEYEGDYLETKETNLNQIDAMYAIVDSILAVSRQIIEKQYAFIEKINPDYIVYDSFAYWGKFISERLRVPKICSITISSVNKEMLQKNIYKIGQIILNKEKNIEISTDKLKITKRKLDFYSIMLRKKYNLSNFDIMDIFTENGDISLVYNSRYLQMDDGSFNDSYVFTGPIITKDEVEEKFNRECNKKVIYISLGSIIYDQEFYKMCMEAFKSNEYNVFMNIGKIKIEDLGEIPSNFIIKNYFPQVSVLQKADLFITHGGANSTREALYFGVPLILIPIWGDQFLVANEVSECGAGIYMNKDSITAIDLKKTAGCVLNNASYKTQADIISKSFHEAGGLRSAVESILNFTRYIDNK